MKKLILTLAVILTDYTFTQAKKYAKVDSDYILENNPQYQYALDNHD